MGKKVTVLGAGIVGLSTAVNIQRCLPDASVEIIAEHFYEQTTSYGSGGMFIPSVQSHTDTKVEKLRQWCAGSWKYYSSLALGPQAGECGAIISTGYWLCNNNSYNSQNPLYKEFVFAYESLSEKAMEDLGFKKLYKYGFKATTVCLDQRKYLLWLQQSFKDNGGRVEKRRVTNINEFVGRCDVLVNCCGLGSRELLGDNDMYAIRGQIVRVKAPWIKHWLSTDDNTYVLPGENYVALGGTRQVGKESLQVEDSVTEDILWRCRNLVPSLQVAEVDHVWVGLRPCRDAVRVEKEKVQIGDKCLQVVHNCGHGADGVGLAWGTAIEAADLVRTCIQALKSTSKL